MLSGKVLLWLVLLPAFFPCFLPILLFTRFRAILAADCRFTSASKALRCSLSFLDTLL